MSFLAPYLLWGSLAAGIPVAIHFFFRSRYRTVPWAAMDFLFQSIKETNRRVRFQELLLLILRGTLLLLLALALARPTSQARSGGAEGDAVDAVLLIDNSMSMDSREAGKTRMQRAIAAARAVVEHLPPHSTTQIITVSDRGELLGPRRPSDVEQARAILDSLFVTARGSDLEPGVRLAVETMRRGSAPNKELYVFSDFQAAGWERAPTPLVESFKEAKSLGAVYLARCGTLIPRNAVLAGIAPQTGIPHTGDRVGFAVLVKNACPDILRNLTVTLTADGDEARRETQPLPRLDPGETRAVSLSARWTEPGLHSVTARVQADELAADDRFDQVLRVREKVRVLVVDGAPAPRDPEKASSYFLMHALLPVRDADKPRYHVQPRVVSPANAVPMQLNDQDVCILTNVAVERDPAKPGEVLAPEFAEALLRFVRDGKTLLIFAGDRVQPAAYTRLFLDRLNMLPLRLDGKKELKEGGEVGFDRASVTDPAFWKFRDDEIYQSFAAVKTRAFLEGAEAPTGRVLLRYTDGKPAIAMRGVGAGSVALVTTSADASWTDAPIRVNAYVPLMDALLTQLLLTGDEPYNASAARGLHWFAAPADAERSFALIRPDGKRIRLGLPEPVQGRARVSAADTPLAGLYRILPADVPDSQGQSFAVTPEAAESLAPETLPDARLNERLGFKPVHLKVTDDTSPFAGSERSKREWAPWLLKLLLVLALGESLLAWWCGRPK